ncbi:MAG: hypothetical protein A2146_07485 [Actinobacteria bacterium RBG_16_67_10]|nr:MAG: hypothetical protein A2146_07485 [Actinobacteria bacterium RBG_16_67_10]
MARQVTTAPKRLRPSAKAVVVHGGRLLVTRNRTPGDDGPDWHIFPGGGQHPGETLHTTLVREVREETGIEITAGPLLWIRELIIANRPERGELNPEEHALEFMFSCELVADRGDAHEEDQYQVSVEWISPDELDGLRFYPAALVPSLRSYLAGGEPGPVYMGDVD